MDNFDNLPLHDKLLFMIKEEELKGSVILQPNKPIILRVDILLSKHIENLKKRSLWDRVFHLSITSNYTELWFSKGEKIND